MLNCAGLEKQPGEVVEGWRPWKESFTCESKQQKRRPAAPPSPPQQEMEMEIPSAKIAVARREASARYPAPANHACLRRHRQHQGHLTISIAIHDDTHIISFSSQSLLLPPLYACIQFSLVLVRFPIPLLAPAAPFLSKDSVHHICSCDLTFRLPQHPLLISIALVSLPSTCPTEPRALAKHGPVLQPT